MKRKDRLRRKANERAKMEMEDMLARYESECKNLRTYKATEEDLIHFEKIYHKKKTFNARGKYNQ